MLSHFKAFVPVFFLTCLQSPFLPDHILFFSLKSGLKNSQAACHFLFWGQRALCSKLHNGQSHFVNNLKLFCLPIDHSFIHQIFIEHLLGNRPSQHWGYTCEQNSSHVIYVESKKIRKIPSHGESYPDNVERVWLFKTARSGGITFLKYF